MLNFWKDEDTENIRIENITENEFNDVFSLDKTTFTEDKFKKLLKRYWYERNTNDVNEESGIVVVVIY